MYIIQEQTKNQLHVDESRTSIVGDENKDCGGKVNEIFRKRCSNNDEDEVLDDDIFFYEFDGEDASSLPLKRRRPSRASKSDKTLLAFNKRREQRKDRYVWKKTNVKHKRCFMLKIVILFNPNSMAALC